MTTKEIKERLRAGNWAWPGGYPLYFIANDGGALSFAAVRANWRRVCHSVRHKMNDGWRVIGCEINHEDNDLYCAHTNEKIPSAYGE